jgi:hypothetical protein
MERLRGYRGRVSWATPAWGIGWFINAVPRQKKDPEGSFYAMGPGPLLLYPG